MISGKVAVVLQARLGSQRLPGKVLEPLAGATLLAHCIHRLQAAGVGPVVVATTTGAADDVVVAEARRLNVAVFRGADADVLGRFGGAVAAVGAEIVVRATADNPAVDVAAVQRLVEALRAERADHAVEAALPYGSTVEAVTAMALRDASDRTANPFDREHVTPYIRRAGSGFKCLTLTAPPSVRRPDLRFTVDTPADLTYMRRVLRDGGATGGHVVPLVELIAAADRLAAHQEVA
ncbi:MAG: NTP transferase domain-containing protein [Vicinamibacterales bacterium]